MAEDKPSKPAGKPAAKPEPELELEARPVTFAQRGEQEPETVTATFGETGEDPLEVGFVGTKPKDD